MPAINATMSQFEIQKTAARIKAQKRANDTGLVYLLYVDPRNGMVDFIAEVDQWQIGQATRLPGKVWPDRRHRSLAEELSERGETQVV